MTGFIAEFLITLGLAMIIMAAAITTISFSKGPSEHGERFVLRFAIVWPSGTKVYEWRL